MMLDEPLLLVHAVLVMFIWCHLQVADGASLQGSTVCEDTDRGWPQYYDKTDNQCHKCIRCEAGFGLSEICGSGVGKNAFCIPCPTNEFSKTASASVCEPCRVCDNTMDDTISCTTEHDRKCGLCILGYFRHQPRDDHCVSCKDERSSHQIPDCQRTPEPVSDVFMEQGSTTEKSITTSEPLNSKGSPTTTIVVIMLVFVLVLVVIVVAVVIRCRRPIQCPCKSSTNKRPAPQFNTYQNENGCPSEGLQPGEMSELLPTGNNSPPTDTTTTPVALAQVPVVTHVPERVVLDQAVPILSEASTDPNTNGIATCSPPSEPTTGEDLQSHSTTSSQTGSSLQNISGIGQTGGEKEQSSAASTPGAQRRSDPKNGEEPTIIPPQCENPSEFERIVEDAVALTRDTRISQMDYRDTRLLDKMLHERPEFLANPLKFHYVKFGELFNIPNEDLQMISTATEVLNRIRATHQDEPTVAELLTKLKDTGECCHVVRELAKQIVKRGN